MYTFTSTLQHVTFGVFKAKLNNSKMLVFAMTFSGKICMNKIKKKKTCILTHMTSGNFKQSHVLNVPKSGSYF